MIRFRNDGSLEVCVDNDRYVSVPDDESLAFDTFPIPVQVRALESKVIVSMRAHGIALDATFDVDRRAKKVSESQGCLAPSLKEWSHHFLEFLGYAT